jgi:NIPSNAP
MACMAARQTVVELRQYTLRPGQREVLIDIFDSNLIESQEAVGISVIGQFRDLDRPDRFVWLRGFEDMDERARSLADFYGGPVWRANSAEANATMIDTDDVLLLRPAAPGSAFRLNGASRLDAAGFVETTILHLDGADQRSAVRGLEQEVAPAIAESGGTLLGYFVTEPAENTFPSLPVREGEDVLVWFAGFAELADGAARREAALRLGPKRPPEVLRLEPTTRSLLDGQSSPQRERSAR